MILDMERLFSDYGVDVADAGSKHIRPGWVQTSCPFCTGNPGFHLGYNLTSGYFNCWRCGFHPTEKVLSIKLNVRIDALSNILTGYKLRGIKQARSKKEKKQAATISLPVGACSLSARHRAYLRGRGFDDVLLEDLWGLKGTGPVGPYKHRIIAPITYKQRLVSFQGRDITNKATLRYKACAMDYEIRHHKEVLYGYDQAFLFGNIPIIVEGITDVWRLGYGAVATFGIEYTNSQVLRIYELFHDAHRVFFLFDDDPQAQIQSRKLMESLRLAGLNCEQITLKGDPGSMKQVDADKLIKSLTKKLFVFSK